MCGVFAIIGTLPDIDEVKKYFLTIQCRGPDKSTLKTFGENAIFGFHRLSIIGDEEGEQPIIHNNIVLICNGEIYNYEKLTSKYEFVMNGTSDCEVIIHMYEKFGIERTLKELDGVFAFILYDPEVGVFAARDPIGIRPLYFARDNDRIAFGSEMKSVQFCNIISQFPPGHWWYLTSGFTSFYSLGIPIVFDTKKAITANIKMLLTDAVEKRLMTDRPIAALLSGGLDSSLIAALVQKLSDKPINTYAIGLEGSPDLKYAKIVANHIGSNHKNLIVAEDTFLNLIPETIHRIESFDVTTVRASVGNLAVSRWISKNSDDKVIFVGDVSDEIFGGYRGFSLTDNDKILGLGIMSMMKKIHYFDVLRSDRSISGAGLEARVPYADKKFMSYVLSIPAKYKMFGDTIIEKNLLRKAFSGDNLIPEEVLNRRKEAFSDGVSGEKSWYEIIQDHAETLYTDEEFEERSSKYIHCPPYDKESLWYREIFEKFYKGRAGIIPNFWKQPFSDEVDPSARKLDCY